MCTELSNSYHQLDVVKEKYYKKRGRIKNLTLIIIILYFSFSYSLHKTFLKKERIFSWQKMSCPNKPSTGVKKKDDDAEDADENDSGVYEMWQEFLHSLTLHGFRFIFEPGPAFRRIVWLGILLCAISMVFNQSRKSITKYLAYPITTSVQVEFLEQITFPAVTICNFNLFPYYLINGTIGEKVSFNQL